MTDNNTWRRIVFERIPDKREAKRIADEIDDRYGYMWITTYVPMVGHWHDGTRDIFFMESYIREEDSVEPYEFMVSEKTKNELEEKINEPILSRVLRSSGEHLNEPDYPFKTIDELYSILRKVGVYDEYMNAVKEREEEIEEAKKILSTTELPVVSFHKYTSWETGITFYVLNDKGLPESLLNVLKDTVDLYNHSPDADLEERFRGWTFRPCCDDIVGAVIDSAKKGIKIVIEPEWKWWERTHIPNKSKDIPPSILGEQGEKIEEVGEQKSEVEKEAEEEEDELEL